MSRALYSEKKLYITKHADLIYLLNVEINIQRRRDKRKSARSMLKVPCGQQKSARLRCETEKTVFPLQLTHLLLLVN